MTFIFSSQKDFVELEANITISGPPTVCLYLRPVPHSDLKLGGFTSHNQCERKQTESNESCDCVSVQTVKTVPS